MAVLTYSEISDIVKDHIVGNVSVDAPVGTAELLRAINDAYLMVWEISGGGIKQVGSPTAWQAASTATGVVFGLLTDVKEPLHLYVSSTAPSSLTTVTNATTTLTSSALFASIKPGMHITGTGIPSNTYVISVESTSSLTLSQAATDSTSTARAFNDTGEVSGTKLMTPKDLAYIQWLKKSDLTGTYAQPKVYSLSRLAAGTPASAGVTDVGKLRLDYWPPSTGYYFPLTYIPQFTPLDGGTSDVPDVNDLESYDIGYLAALDLCPREGRAELGVSIAGKISERTSAALDRKLAALVSADQDR